MKKLYFREHVKFLKRIVKGRSYAEIAKLFNKQFRFKATELAVKTLCLKHGLRNGFGTAHGNPNYKPKRKYKEKHLEYLRLIVPGTPYKIILEKFNKRFGFELSLKALRALCKKYCIQNGFTGYFTKGHVPFNKGMKGYCSPGCEVSWFKSGQKPYNTMQIGEERITADGYVEIKYSNRSGFPSKRWKGKHVLLYEKVHGPVPKGHAVIFADGNNRNFKISNLMLVSRAELLIMNRRSFISNQKKLTEIGKNIAKLLLHVEGRKRRTITSSRRKLVIIDNNKWEIIIVRNSKGYYVPARKYEWGLQTLLAKECPPRKTRERAEEDLKAYAIKRRWQRL